MAGRALRHGCRLVLALAMNVGMYWFSDRLVLKMTGAAPLTSAEAPKLYRMTERLAREAGIPMPRLYVVPDPQPNAFAIGRNPERDVVGVPLACTRDVESTLLTNLISRRPAPSAWTCRATGVFCSSTSWMSKTIPTGCARR